MGTPIFQMPLAGSTFSPDRRYPGGTTGAGFNIRVDINNGGAVTIAAGGAASVPATSYVSTVLTAQNVLSSDPFYYGGGAVVFTLIDGKIKATCATPFTWDMTHAADDTQHMWWGLAASASISGVLTGGSYVYTFPYQPAGIWYPGRGATEDTRQRRPTKGSVASSISGVRRVSIWSNTPKKERTLTFMYVDQQYALAEYEPLAPENNSFEQFWDYVKNGHTFKMADDASNPTWADYVVADISEPLQRSAGYKVYWDVNIKLART